MSGAYGDSREKRFKAYFTRIGRPPYAPDYLENLLTVMADPSGCAQHRVLAWAIYRAPGNQNEFAIYLGTDREGRSEEILLSQTDCALDLAWLEAGYPPEWLDAPRPVWHAAVSRRGVQPLDKSAVSPRRIRSSGSCAGNSIRPNGSSARSRRCEKRKRSTLVCCAATWHWGEPRRPRPSETPFAAWSSAYARFRYCSSGTRPKPSAGLAPNRSGLRRPETLKTSTASRSASPTGQKTTSPAR